MSWSLNAELFLGSADAHVAVGLHTDQGAAGEPSRAGREVRDDQGQEPVAGARENWSSIVRVPRFAGMSVDLHLHGLPGTPQVRGRTG